MDEKQKQLELKVLANLPLNRMFMGQYEAVCKIGVTEDCFRHSDTRSAWKAVAALIKANSESWGSGRADEVEITLALEDHIDHAVLEQHRVNSTFSAELRQYAIELVSSHERNMFKKHLSTSLAMVDNCSDVQTGILLVKQSLGQFENRATLRNNSVDIEQIGNELSRVYVAAHEARQRGESPKPNGLQMPWKVMNDLYNGVRNGLNIVAARPSNGKTVCALNVSMFWRMNGIKHAFITLDMPKEQLAKRYGCLETEISEKHLLSGRATMEQIEAHRQAIANYKDMVFLYESPDLASVEMAIREAHHMGATAFMVDYLQLVQAAGTRNKWDSVIAATSSLKGLTRELKMTGLVLAQLNRQGVRDGREPELHDIEGGGFIEQAAATVLTIDRDKSVIEEWALNPPVHLLGGRHGGLAQWLRPVWLNLMKNQDGPIGKVPFVMYCPFFALRPANHEAVPDSGRNVCENVPFFSEIRDDWRKFGCDN